jgi:hypothetical protein
VRPSKRRVAEVADGEAPQQQRAFPHSAAIRSSCVTITKVRPPACKASSSRSTSNTAVNLFEERGGARTSLAGGVAREQVEQRRFAAAARAHHGQGLAGSNVEVDRVKRAHQAIPASVLLRSPLACTSTGADAFIAVFSCSSR